MWMSDKPLNQQRLARDLADLLNVVRGTDNFLGLVDAFWKTMAREWSGIDALRMDKFLYLVRCYVGAAFEYLSRHQWGVDGLMEQYLDMLKGVPLNAKDMKISTGLRLHVIDLYVDELDKADTKRDAPLEKILAPLRQLGKDTPTKSVRSRVKEALADERLEDWQNVRSKEDAEDVEDETPGTHESRPVDSDDEFGGFDD